MPAIAKPIDAEEVYKLACLGITNRGIATFFNYDETSLAKRFSKEIQKGKEDQKIRLSQLQWASAERGNVVMQIWLGKQILGQADKNETKDTTDPGVDLSKYPSDFLESMLKLYKSIDQPTGEPGATQGADKPVTNESPGTTNP